MNDGVEARQVLRRNVPNIQLKLGNPGLVWDELKCPEEIAVEADDFVTGRAKHRHHHAADIAIMPSNKNTHDLSPLIHGLICSSPEIGRSPEVKLSLTFSNKCCS